MRRHRWEWVRWAAACGLSIAGAASAHDRIAEAPEAAAIRERIAVPFGIEPVLGKAVLRVREARHTTIFLPQAEFLFAPARPDDAPR